MIGELRYFKTELMTLVTEVFGFAVHQMAVRTHELILIVRRNMRIGSKLPIEFQALLKTMALADRPAPLL